MRVLVFLHSLKDIPPERCVVSKATPQFYHVVGGSGALGREQGMIDTDIV
jgi:hypothetical protein